MSKPVITYQSIALKIVIENHHPTQEQLDGWLRYLERHGFGLTAHSREPIDWLYFEPATKVPAIYQWVELLSRLMAKQTTAQGEGHDSEPPPLPPYFK